MRGRFVGGGVTALLASCMLAACGGGSGSGGIGSTPVPPAPPAPTPAPSPAPTPACTGTAEFCRSNGPVQHGAITAYNAGASGAGITVGIIDSGIAQANSEFTGRISSASKDFAGNSGIEDEGGHGTAVATVLAGAKNGNLILGMAWNATILALRTDTPGSCATEKAGDAESGCKHSTLAIANALDHARMNGARVVNISLGGESAVGTSLIGAIDRATAAGVIVVVSAGNDGSAAPDGFAGSLVDAAQGRGLVIIAGSVNASGVHSSFSDGALGYEQSTLSAIGESVLSQNNKGATFLYDGTSFSAPQIAGAAALLAQAFPGLTGAQIVKLLLDSATDAGATGADAVYGRGILNLTRAFAPVGATSLAGSATPVSLIANGSLSSAMGDAADTGATRAVVLDDYRRAYQVNLKGTMQGSAPSLMLAPALQIRQRVVAADAGPVSVAMAIAPGRGNMAEAQRLMLSPQDATQARLLSGSIITRVAPGTTVALGFSQGASGLSARIAGAAEPAFLVASGTGGAIGFERRAGSSMALRHNIAPRLALTFTAEQGQAWRSRADGHDPLRLGSGREAGYISVGVAAERRAGPWRLTAGATMLREQASLLGARFGPAFGPHAGRSLFVDMDARFDVGAGWEMGASIRQGWTTAGSHARLTSNAWAVDAGRRGLLMPADRLAVRLSQPLRVETGGLILDLPVSYDYMTQSAVWSRTLLGLAPKGREIDGEALYSRPVGPGWITTNLYWRRQSGNLAWFPDEMGGALRYSLVF